MTLHDYIPEFQDTTGRNVSDKAASFLKAVDAALSEFKACGAQDSLNGRVAIPEEACIKWAESHIFNASDLAKDVGKMAYEAYLEGYKSNVDE